MTDSSPAGLTASTDTIPVEQIAGAVSQTIASPSLGVLAEDLVLVHQLVTEVKAKLAGKPVTLLTIFEILFNLA